MKSEEFEDDKLCCQIEALERQLEEGEIVHTKELAEIVVKIFKSICLHSEVLAVLTKEEDQ